MTPSSSTYADRWTTLAAVVFALSWLLPNHHEPWVDFHSDAWAALSLGVLGAVVLWRSRSAAGLTWHMLPLLALACAGVVWLQYAGGLVESFGVAWIGTLYLLGLALALLVGAAWERWRPGLCADFLFIAALVGATGSVAVQLQQWLRIDPGPFFWLFIPPPPTRVHANLGQPNQLSTLLCLGVLACAWLHGKIGVRSRFQAVTLRDTLAATVDCSSPQALGRRAGPRLNTRLKAGPARTACTPWRG